MKIVGGQLDCNRSDVFFEPMQLRRARDRHNPRLLRKQPGECYLGRRRLLMLRDLAEQIDECLIRLPVFGVKARDAITEIGAIELCILADRSRKEAFAKRAKWNEPDSEFFECGDNLFFRLSPPERIFTLQCGDWLNRVRATDRPHTRFGKTKVLYFAFPNQILNGSCR